MELSELLSAVVNNGFAIVAYFVLCYAIKYLYDKTVENDEKDRSEITTLTKAVAENTNTLARLVDEVKEMKK